jgi:hypothetical protein
MKITPSLTHSVHCWLRPSVLLFVSFLIGCFGLLPKANAVSPPPDGGYPGGNTAEGQNALLSLTTGTYNTAVGLFSLLSNIEGHFNTAVGAGTLLANTADSNTATGAGALLSNTSGGGNTANGAFALFNNIDGLNNNAVGFFALLDNTSGDFNNALGHEALESNVDGGANNAFGDLALFSNVSGSGNTAIGNGTLFNCTGNSNVPLGVSAGTGITDGTNIIAIGAGVSGISSAAGQVDDSCYIGNIHGAGVEPATSAVVFVDADGKLGTDSFANGRGGNVSVQVLLKEHRKVQQLETTVAQLAAQLKEQAAQLQRVSAQLDASRSTPQLVLKDQ